MKRSIGIVFGVIFATLLIFSCKSEKEREAQLTDTKYSGKINISVDESFKPVMDEMVKVYESNYPGTTINASYKAESDCLKDMFVDSVRMVVTTRVFSEGEKRALSDSLKMTVHHMVVAKDAIAVVINPKSADSLFTMDEIKSILEGTYTKNLVPVFDGNKATSTVRFILDSVMRGKPFGENVVAAQSTAEAIDFISKTPNAIGFVGVSWFSSNDKNIIEGLPGKVKIARIESQWAPDTYVFPLQANLFNRSYPMARDLIYMVKEKHLYKGLGNAFANFLTSEQGQLIFRRANLMPVVKDFGMRKATLND